MAKTDKNSQDNEKVILKLFSAIKNLNSVTDSMREEQLSLNRELAKVLTLVSNNLLENDQEIARIIDRVESGGKVTEDFIKRVAKERKVSVKELDRILLLVSKVEKLDEKAINNSKTVLDLYKDRVEQVKEDADLTKQIYDNQEKILKSVKASKKEMESYSGSVIDTEEVTSKIAANKTKLDSVFAGMFNGAKDLSKVIDNVNSDIDSLIASVTDEYMSVNLNFNPVTNELDDAFKTVLANVDIEKEARMNALEQYFKTNDELQKNMARQMAAQMKGLKVEVDVDTGSLSLNNKLLEVGSSEYEKLTKSLDRYVKKHKLMDTAVSNIQDMVNYLKLGTDITDDQSKHFDEIIARIGEANVGLVQNTEIEIQNLENLKVELMQRKALVEQVSKSRNALIASGKIVDRIASGFEQINSLLPSGIGEFLGLSRVSRDLTDSHIKGVQKFTKELEGGSSVAKATQEYLKSFNVPLGRMLTVTNLVVVAFAALYKFVSDLGDKYKTLSSEMQISLGQAKQMYETQIDTLTSQKNQFATLKDIQEIQSKMIAGSGKVFGLTNKDSKELVINLAETSKYFGYNNEQAVTLHKMFTRLGADDKMALNLQQNLGLMSEMAGLSPQIVAQDMVESAEMVATYFAGMPNEAAKAAIQVRRMGLSLQQAGSIAQQMLDLEGFMTNMYELQAMTAGGIDFSGAFEKGLMGDLEGMTAEIMKNIGSVEELNKMDYLTRTKIAKTLGMSNEELTKAVKLNQDMAGLTEDQKKYLTANMNRMGDISNLSKDEIRQRMEALQSTDRLSVAWEKIKTVFVKSLIPLAESFASGIDAIMPIIDIIVLGLKGIGLVVGTLAPVLKGMLYPFELIGKAISFASEKLDVFFGKAQVGTSVLDKMKTPLEWIGKGLGFILLAKHFKSFLGIFKGLFKIIPFVGSLFGGAKQKAVDSMSTATTAMQEAASTISTSMTGVSNSIIQSMQDVANAIRNTFSSTSGGVKTLSNETDKLTSNLAQKAQNNLKAVEGSTVEMSTKVESAVEKTEKKIKKSSSSSLVSSGVAASTIKTLSEIGTKAAAAWAINSALSFTKMKSEGEAQTSEMADNMSGMMDVAFMGMSGIIASYLQSGVEKVFTKKLEKVLETGLENPVKKVTESFEGVGQKAGSVFTKIGGKAKSIFGGVGSMVKQLSMSPNVSGTFDSAAKQTEVITKNVDKVQDVMEKVKTKKLTEVTEPVSKMTEATKPGESVKQVTQSTGSAFTTFKSVLKDSWDGIKTVLTDLVKFVSESMSTLGTGIGKAIKGVLTGIADGLNSFKTSALKGAASLLIVSAALWTTAEAIKNFEDVKPELMIKAGVSLAVLTGAAFVLGKAKGAILEGSLAIGVLGVALIPLAYALQLAAPAFDSLAKIIDSAGNLIVNVLSEINSIITNVSAQFKDMFTTLTSVDVGKLLLIGPALASIGVGLAAFSAGSLIGSATSMLGNLFGDDLLEKMEKMAQLASPLTLLSNTLAQLNEQLSLLAETINTVDLDNFTKLSNISLDSNIVRKLAPIIQQTEATTSAAQNVRISPVQPQVANVQPPNKESVAQNELLSPQRVAQTQMMYAKPDISDLNFMQNANKTNFGDSYNNETISEMRTTELYLQKLVQLTEALLRKDSNLNMDGSKVNSRLKALNNN